VPGRTPATFRNIGATRHEGIESAVDYRFAGALEGLSAYANWNYTRAIQASGATAGLDVPFCARRTGTLGARYETGAFSADLSDRRYYTRNVDGNAGRMAGAPRTAHVQARMTF
jgi:Fe(3+) dicitrate transport protein